MPRGNPREKKKLTWGAHSPNRVSYIGDNPIPPEGISIHVRGNELFKRSRKRARKRRCPRCKKIRLFWMHPNMERGKRRNRVYKLDEQRVCHVCWKRSDESAVEEVHET